MNELLKFETDWFFFEIFVCKV